LACQTLPAALSGPADAGLERAKIELGNRRTTCRALNLATWDNF
jgi:hypothetical protein